MKFNIKEFGEELAGVIAAELRPLRDEVKALRERCQALESRLETPAPTHAEVKSMVEQAVKSIPAPKDGADGRDGKDGTGVTLADVQPIIEQAVKSIPAPKDGADGRDGKDGTSVTLADVQPIIEQAVKSLEIPKPADGRDGKDGASVTLGDIKPLIEQAVKAIEIPKPADGVGVAGAMIDRDDCLLLTLTNGEVKNLGVVVGKDGQSFEAFDLTYDADNHEIVAKARCGNVTKEARAPIHGITLGGYWRDGTKAKAQEAWSHGGCLWIAKQATSSKPDASSEDWILAARKGRDGEGVERAAPPTGPVKLKG